MTATLEATDVLQTTIVVVDADDYLDARRPGWRVLEKAGAVTARDGKVSVKPEASAVLDTIGLTVPAKYQDHRTRPGNGEPTMAHPGQP